jgi:hypothetical protein
MAQKRKLPVLGTAASEGDDGEARPGWQWVGFGATAVFAVWVPLAFCAQWLSRHGLGLPAFATPEATRDALASLGQGERTRLVLGLMLPHVAAFGAAAAAGGFLIGRYGPALGPREGAMAGLAAGLVAVVLAAANGFSPALLVVPLLGAAFGATGAAFGNKRRMRA